MSQSFAAARSARWPRWAVGVGVLGAVVLAAVWAVPGWMDWSAYRGPIAAYATRALGRPVHIDGPIAVSLLPSPMLTAGEVRLDDRGDGIAMAAPALRLRLAAGPLLTGRLVPRALILLGATIRMPWPLPPAVLGADSADWLASASARIEASTLVLGAVTVRDVTADLGPDTGDLGGIGVTGTGRAGGQSWSFSGALGGADAEGDAPFEASVQAAGPGAGDSGAHFAGLLLRDGSLRGRVSAHATDLSRLLPVPGVAASVDGTLSLGAGPALGALNLVVGDVSGTATLGAAADGTTQSVSVALGAVDLDRWRLPRRRGAALGVGWLGRVRLDVSAGAVTLGGGVLRAVHGVVDWAGGGGRISDGAAILPGEAPLAFAGAVGAEGFDGTFSLDAPQLRQTLDWLIGCGLRLHADLPPEVLRQATLTGRARVSGERVDLDGLTGAVEQSAVAGHVGVERASGAIDADLTLDRLAVDNWLPVGGLPSWPALSSALADVDLALKLRVGRATLRGEAIDTIVLDAATDAGGVAVNSAAFDVDGLHGGLAGTIDRDGTVGGFVLDLGTDDTRGLAGHLPGWALVSDQLWAGPVRLHVEANGPREALLTSVGLDLSDARLEAHPTIDLTKGVWSTQMTLRHPGAPRLLAALGWPHAGAWLGEGSLSMLAQLSGAPGVVRFDSFDLTAAALHATGDLALAMPAGQAPSLTGHVNADTLPLPGLQPHDATPVAVGWLSGLNVALPVTANSVSVGATEVLTGAKARLGLAQGVLRLDGLTATLGGGTLSGGLALDTGAMPPKFSVRAGVVGATLTAPLFGTRIDVGAGKVDATLDLAGQGFSPAAVLASLAGSVTAQMSGGALVGFDLDAAQEAGADAAALSAGQNGGMTPFDTLNLAGDVAYGVVSLKQFGLAGSDGALSASGQVDLSGGVLDLLAAMPDARDLRLTGPISAPVLGPTFGR